MKKPAIDNSLGKSKIYYRATSFLTALLIILFFESCEGYRCADGTVLDRITNLPLDSVFVEVITADSRAIYTDTTGKFDVCNKLGGCMPCKDIMIRFSKDDYESVTLTNPEKNAVVKMEK